MECDEPMTMPVGVKVAIERDVTVVEIMRKF
jgi:hypothetical protein